MSEHSREDHPRGGFVGPIESAEDALVQPSPPQARRRLTPSQLVVLLVLLIVAVALAVRQHPAARPTPAPPPYPAQVTAIDYGGPAHEAASGERSFTLRLVATATGRAPVDVVAVQQSYRGLTLLVESALPATASPGHPAVLQVRYLVTDCSGAPADPEQPYLDVTLRNNRAIQTVSQILGDEYAHELSRNLRSACQSPAIRTLAPASRPPNTLVR